VADHLTREQAAESLLNAFKRAVRQELELLDVAVVYVDPAGERVTRITGMRNFLRTLLNLLTAVPLLISGAWLVFTIMPLTYGLATVAFSTMTVVALLELTGFSRRMPLPPDDYRIELRLVKRIITSIGGYVGIGAALCLLATLSSVDIVHGAFIGVVGAAAGMLIGYATATIILRE
jgi:hypothetical protein